MDEREEIFSEDNVLYFGNDTTDLTIATINSCEEWEEKSEWDNI